jgi:Uma2 family endonuclease
MSYEEYLAWADEDVHAEWVAGEVVVQLPPKEWHQRMVAFLERLLGLYAEFFGLGRVLAAPFEMRLSPEGPSRQPDILFVARANLSRLRPERLEGPADLVVEVVSDESLARDRGEKFYEYEEAGVGEYWVVDPRPGKERADFWVRGEDGRYRPAVPDAEGVYRSRALPGFWLRMSWLRSGALPDPVLAFGEIAGLPPAAMEALEEAKRRGPLGG